MIGESPRVGVVSVAPLGRTPGIGARCGTDFPVGCVWVCVCMSQEVIPKKHTSLQEILYISNYMYTCNNLQQLSLVCVLPAQQIVDP